MKHPIDNIQWIDVKELNANDYNPNVVFNKELQLLEYSMLKNGWIQPVLATKDLVIIDGFHRWYLSKNSKKLQDAYGTKIPVAIIDINEAERMLLTIRINRAKGSHIALKMHEIVKMLVEEYQLTPEYIASSIGANKDEIEILMMDNVFKALDIENKNYSKAWYPKKK